MTGSTMLVDSKTYLQPINITSISDIKKAGMKLSPVARDALKGIGGNKESVDTFIEYTLAVYYYPPITITDISAKAKQEAELPHDNVKIAECKLGAMLLKARVEDAIDIEGYRKGIDYILENKNVTEIEITAYYNEAIVNDISLAAKEEFKALVGKLPIGISDAMRAALIKPLITYYQDPSTQNWDKFVKIYAAIYRKAATDLRYAPLLTVYDAIIKNFSGLDFFAKLVNSEMAIYKNDKVYIAEYKEICTIVDGK